MRKVSLVDIGSNTIRLVTYNIQGDIIEEVLNERVFAGIIEHIDNKVLTYDGFEILISSLNKLKHLNNLVEAEEINCFATASLRNVENVEGLKSRIKDETGLDIRILTGEDEIYYDYVALKKSIASDEGIGLDLGGGSCQVFKFDKEGIKESASMPIGCLLMYKKCVSGVVPRKKELKLIKNTVKTELKKFTKIKNMNYNTIYCMGGSARAAAKLHRAIVGGSRQIADYELTIEQIDDVIQAVYDMDIRGVRLLCHVIPERVYTILPGLVTLRTICKFTGAKKIRIVKNSVREGYLWENILKKDSLLIGN